MNYLKLILLSLPILVHLILYVVLIIKIKNNDVFDRSTKITLLIISWVFPLFGTVISIIYVNQKMKNAHTPNNIET